MEAKEIQNIEKQAKAVAGDIQELKRQIKSYKSGAESFESSAQILGDLTDKIEKLSEEIQSVFAGLMKLDGLKIVDTQNEMSKRLGAIEQWIVENQAEISKRLTAVDERGAETESKISKRLDAIEQRLSTGVKIKWFGK
jgi:predicted  nucleic acid-binding Zn-ribbon protein